MRMLNLGILAHVDAGKTSLTERLLFDAGAIPTMGAVDDGSTQTDAMDLERRRGITIRSAVATFTTGGHEIHLIDTPGHPDFIAEVERALGVLDGAVLVLSAVEGVQAQTRILMRTLRSAGVPTLLFVNKTDRRGARHLELLPDIRRLLSPSAVAVRAPAAELAEILAEHSDTVLESYLDAPDRLDETLLRAEFAAQARAGLVHPVFFGSAITGHGIDELLAGITEFLPTAGGDDTGPLDGTVFAIERDPVHGRSAVVRLFGGSIDARDVVPFAGRGSAKVTGVRAADRRPGRVGAGGIAYVTGLRGIRIGDRLGSASTRPAPRFRPPTQETVVTAPDPGALFRALTELADQDPLIDVRRADEHGSLVVSLYGEVQREVIAARLAEEFGVVADFSPPRIICVEQLAGVGTALREIGPNPATVGLRVEPGPADSGTRFGLEVERGSLPRAFMTAIEDTVHASLRHGPHGWRVLDCTVTLTHTAYWSPSTVAGDFRYLVPLVLMAALRRAGTVVCEPLDRAELEVPADALTAVLAAITRCGGLPDVPVVRGDSCSIDAVMPVARLRDLARLLPGITGGVGVLTSRFEGYRPVSAGVDTPTPPRVVAP